MKPDNLRVRDPILKLHRGKALGRMELCHEYCAELLKKVCIGKRGTNSPWSDRGLFDLIENGVNDHAIISLNMNAIGYWKFTRL